MLTSIIMYVILSFLFDCAILFVANNFQIVDFKLSVLSTSIYIGTHYDML